MRVRKIRLMADKDEDKKQIGIKDKLMLYITLGVLGFVALVIGGEYLVIMYSQSKTDEVVEAQPEVIALVQNALVGLIGIIGGYFGAKATKGDE
jgi:flagellar basal body-associated protein FliL